MNQSHERKGVVMIINKKIVANMEVPRLQQLTINCLIHLFKGEEKFTDEKAQSFVDLLQNLKHYSISLGLSDRVDLQEILFNRCTQAQFEAIVGEDLYVLGAIDQLVIEKLGWGVALYCLDKGLIGYIDLSYVDLTGLEELIDWDRLDLSSVMKLDLEDAKHVPMGLIAKALEAGVKEINLSELDLTGLEKSIDWGRLDLSGVEKLDLWVATHVPMPLIAKALNARVKTIILWNVDLTGLEALIDWDRLDLSDFERLGLFGAIDLPIRLIVKALKAGVKTIDLSYVDLTGLEESIDLDRLDLTGVETLELEFASDVPMGLIAKVLEAGVKEINLTGVDLTGLEASIDWDRLDLSDVKNLALFDCKNIPPQLSALWS